MKFKNWMEAEASLGSNMPDMLASMPNRGSPTTASDKVKETGLQPQVDSQEIHTKQKDEKDKILAIDAGMQRFDKEIPQSKEEDMPKVNKFKELWNQLKSQWEELKMSQNPDDQSEEGDGLADTEGDPGYTDTMRQYPNMVPGSGNYPTNIPGN